MNGTIVQAQPDFTEKSWGEILGIPALRHPPFFAPLASFAVNHSFLSEDDGPRIAGCGLPAKRERHRAEIQTLEQQIDALHLRLVHSDGSEIPVAAFRPEDCAYTLTEHPREHRTARRRGQHSYFLNRWIIR